MFTTGQMTAERTQMTTVGVSIIKFRVVDSLP